MNYSTPDALTVFAAQRKARPTLTAAKDDVLIKLSNLRLHNIVGEGDDQDAERLIDDLEAIWQIVDPLIEKIGQYAADNFHGVDAALFRNQLRGALEGNATFNLHEAAERIREDRRNA